MDELDRQRPPGHTGFDDAMPPDLQRVAHRYAAQPAPRPRPEETARLLSRLLTEDTQATLAVAYDQGLVPTMLRVARWRMRLLGPWFWIASVLLVLGGELPALLTGKVAGIIALVLLLPLTAVLGLVHALRTLSVGLREVEGSCPISFVESSAGLALAIIGFDCLLGVMVTLALALAQWASFGALLAAWLGPLLLITGISLLVALRWGALLAVVIGGGPWLLLALIALINPAGTVALVFALPHDLLSLALHLVAAVLGGLIVLLLILRGSTWPYMQLSFQLNGVLE